MMRRISGKYAVGCLLLLALFGSLLNVSAQESNTGKGKGKAPAAGAGEKKGSGKAGKEPLTGTWKGTYTREGNTNEITLDLVQKGNTVTGSLIVADGTLPVEKGVYYNADEKKFTFESGPSPEERYQVTGTLKGSTLSGQWKGAGQSGPFSVTRSKSAD